MASIDLTQDTHRLLMAVAGYDARPDRISGVVFSLCQTSYRAKLAASSRPGRTWHECFAPSGVGPVPAPSASSQALPERTWQPEATIAVGLAPYAAESLLGLAGEDPGPERIDRCLWDLCLAYYRTELVDSPRPACPDEVLDVAVRLSYRQGLVSDFQGVAVVACAHAPACHRLASAPGCEPETVACADIAAWLQAKAEAGAEAERARTDSTIDVEARTATCSCLDGTPLNDPRGYPDQPDDVVYLVGTDLAERYEELFGNQYFGTHLVSVLEDVKAVKEMRWIGYSHDELYGCSEDHDDEDCPDYVDPTFECVRDCDQGCDWVLYPREGHAHLAVHGNDIDLGPLEEDHTAQLTDHLLPDLRL
jgi:hypothetical protein